MRVTLALSVTVCWFAAAVPAATEPAVIPQPCAMELTEVTWSPKGPRDYDGFLRRLTADERRLDQLGVNYRRGALGDGSEAPAPPR
jgi:hypothetical protein